MKSQFGSFFNRLYWGGVTLNPLEVSILTNLVEHLPPTIRVPALKQLEGYNLVQRECDGRALNFYKLSRRKPTTVGLSELPIKAGEVTLLKMTFTLQDNDKVIHATMTAVDKRVFCVNFSHDTRRFASARITSVSRIIESWRSDILSSKEFGNTSNSSEVTP